jgi:hypothetical protein
MCDQFTQNIILQTSIYQNYKSFRWLCCLVGRGARTCENAVQRMLVCTPRPWEWISLMCKHFSNCRGGRRRQLALEACKLFGERNMANVDYGSPGTDRCECEGLPGSIPTAPTIHLPDGWTLNKNARGQKRAE